MGDVPGRHEPGTGELNYHNIFKKIEALGYRGYVGMEFAPTGDNAKEDTAYCRWKAVRTAQSHGCTRGIHRPR